MTKNFSSKYSIKGMNECEFEPGSRNKVLKNLLHLKSKREIEQAEWEALKSTQPILLAKYNKRHRFTARDILKMHKLWLGNIYRWAGAYRNVNLSKGDFHFSVAKYLPHLMQQFEKNELKKYTPCNFDNLEEIVEAISIVHAEFIIIHPFREGNGRLGRLLAGVMAMQANLPMLDYTHLAGKHRKDYISAIHDAVGKNYEPMKEVFQTVIQKTLRKFSV